MELSQGGNIGQAASELIERLGRKGALSFVHERMERFVQQGDWSSHDAAARMLSALESAAGARPPSGLSGRPDPDAI
jgi:hypothetical protein